jgi:hypothetical protein
MEGSRVSIEDDVCGAIESNTVGNGVVKMNGVLLQVHLVFGWEMVW